VQLLNDVVTAAAAAAAAALLEQQLTDQLLKWVQVREVFVMVHAVGCL
jgi:uncharacterized membrane protein YgdD (TMEM256/DUF423 family)